ncbi:class I SAM-dependent methyltransferase [uncultured Paludibaculum sp.]|uniref:SAM-dependent methyltransferase n=1 Tax=uncultured Paludibaculum sp. TaxID=1765020 RepID=UPI002AAB52DA|nr:methyltransferase domain-containing protein [uncultured Paludibaculum sp.]
MIRPLILALSVFALVVSAQEATPRPAGDKLAPYYPTPESVVERMLKFGGLKRGEKMFDLGSGDGRVVVMAAEKFKADATGIEIDTDLYRQSMDRIKSLGLEKHARIINGDITQQDFSSANLLTVYLLPNSNEKIRPMLEKQLKKGTRIVAHDFMFKGWTADKEEHIPDDGEGRSHTLYLYIR